MNVTLFGHRVSADVIKLICYQTGWGWPRQLVTSVFIREKVSLERPRRATRKKARCREAETGVMQLWVKAHTWSREQESKDSSLQPSEGTRPGCSFASWLQASRSVRINACCFGFFKKNFCKNLFLIEGKMTVVLSHSAGDTVWWQP